MRLFIAYLLLFCLGTQPRVWAADENGPLKLIEERALSSVVRCKTGRGWTGGFVLGDKKTIVFAYDEIPENRLVLVETREGKRLKAKVQALATFLASGNYPDLGVMTLTEEIEVPPLRVAGKSPAAGSLAFVLGKEPGKDQKLEMVQTIVLGISRKLVQVGPVGARGMPLLDADGRVIGIYIDDGTCVKPDTGLFEDEYTKEAALAKKKAGRRINLISALRFGAMTGGYLEKDHIAFLLTSDIGFRYWRFSFQARLSFADHTGVQMHRISGRYGDGPGVVSGEPLELRAGLEFKYILLAWRNLWFELVAGGDFSWLHFEPNGLGVFSTTPGCDPLGGACQVTYRDPDIFLEDVQEVGVGPIFGADLDVWVFVIAIIMGYRFIPGALSYNMDNTHIFQMGIMYQH